MPAPTSLCATRTFLMQGNEACATAALDAGMRFFAGYPITPSTEIAEILSARLPKVDGVFIQMEDEIASVGAILGASLAGKKTMTATSGPGFSLMQELIGLGGLCEIPTVIVNVQRGGPSTGQPTAPAQGDVMQARWGTHGDHPVVCLCPSSVGETYRLTIQAFNIAETLRMPVFLMPDEIVAHMREKFEVPEKPNVVNRRLPTVPPEKYQPYAIEPGEDVPRIANFGDGYRFNVTSLVHNETGFPSNKPEVAEALLKRLIAKVEHRRKEITFTESRDIEDAKMVVFSYGTTARSARRAVIDARAAGMKVGWLKTSTLWPFPDELFENLPASVETVLVAEMNLGQLIYEVRRSAPDRIRVEPVCIADGKLITPDDIFKRITAHYR